MFMVYGQPVKDIAMLFRVFQVGYLFLSPARGLSFFWWTRMIALFLATFEFGMLITNKNKKMSFMITMLITFSSTIHWWFAVNYLVEMIVFAEIAIVCIDKFFKEKIFWKRACYSFVIMLCAGNYAFCLYPAWLIPITYIFLPAFVWVFYQNRKNLKLNKKEIILIVVELLVLVALIARILLRCTDVISIVQNTAYPGKRVSNGGGHIIDLFINHVGILLPYADIFMNACEAATITDFWIITIFILGDAIGKKKIKDFLLYFMILISIFLNIYCIIGIPNVFAKITLLQLSTPDRVKGIIGILNIFILARVMVLLKENCYSKKISVIIGLGVSTITTIVAFMIYRQYFTIWQFVALGILTAIMYFLVLQAKSTKYEWALLIVITIFTFISSIGINPLRIGTPIFESKLGKRAIEINEEESGLWITQGVPSNFLIPFGIQQLNSTQIYPNLEIWRKLDEGGKFEEVYNRYASVNVELVNADEVSFKLLAPDSFAITTNIDYLAKIGLKYICSSKVYGEEVNTQAHQLQKIDKVEGFIIYKIVNIGE